MDLERTSFLLGANAAFLADLYQRWLMDRASVDPSWAKFFGELRDDARSLSRDFAGASWAPPREQIEESAPRPNGNGFLAQVAAEANGGLADQEQVRRAAQDSIHALMLIRAYRVRGHLEADLDPLGLIKREPHPELDPKSYGFAPADWGRPIYIGQVLGREIATLREIHQILRETYCGKIGVEFMHIQDPAQKQWIQGRVESIRNQTQFTDRGKSAILERLTRAEAFERFLDRKYTGTKRFGLDGGEAMIPALEQILKRGGQLGLKEVVIGMAHRGRLNVLANLMGKPFSAIFSEFQGNPASPGDVQGSGDVKYHLGTSADRDFDGNTIHLSLTANPSHLEAVNPVVIGKVRAKQMQRGYLKREETRREVMPLLIHGDAAFAGQGLVAETLDLSELKGYRVGGTIHFIINNQIGFTTNPANSRSGPYCSDVAKMIQAPIFHVNGDDPEAVVHVARIAAEFRQEFKKDIVIDMFCYRRFGHNEGDEPAFTQPIMYKAIAKKVSTRKLYARRLADEGVVSEADATAMEGEFQARLERDFEASAAYRPNKADWLEGAWAGLEAASGDERRGVTAVPLDTLREIGLALARVPQGFNANRKIVRQLDAKRKMIESGAGIDWATAEALAWGTLLIEDTPVRVSGQDSARGTFSQRHGVLVDQESEEKYVPLDNLKPGQAHFEIIDSPLSEASVLGFEYGYSLAEPRTLVIWEAQFGDFVNGAQVIIDQFISSGEAKWLRMSGLTLLLPHGHEGQGPEHSSARLERWLQLSAEDNMQVVNCTTPASYFHALRRQIHRKFRKPLIVMTPKSLLRHKAATSSLAEMGPGTSFHRVMWDLEGLARDGQVRRMVLCSGKVYYDLLATKSERKAGAVELIRIEQLYPFPAKALKEALGRHRDAEVVWCQEEPQNMGAWTFMAPRLEGVLEEIGAKYRRPRYVGRPEAASPASGLLRRHNEEQAKLVDEALSLD